MDALREGMAAAKAGDRARAQALLLDHVERNPDSEEGWLLLAAVVDTPEEAVACLERALHVNPRSRRAQAGLKWARSRVKQATPAPSGSVTPAASPAPATMPASRPSEPLESAPPSESTPSGLLRRLTSPTTPVAPRRSSPYAPTRLFTVEDQAKLPEALRGAVPHHREEAAQQDYPVTELPAPRHTAPTTEPPAWGVSGEAPEEVEEPRGPAPSLADRLGGWGAPPGGERVAEPPAWEVSGEAPEEVEEPLGPSPSLADRLGGWGAPPGEERAAEPPAWVVAREAPEEVEEPLGPSPSLADRLGGWGAPPSERASVRPVEPAEPLGPEVDISRRLSRLEVAMPAVDASAADTGAVSTSLTDRLRRLRGDAPAAPAEPVRPTESLEELMARGEGALEAGRVEEAERAFRQAVGLDPSSPEAHANLAMAHYINGRRAEAIAELKIAVQRYPEYEDALYTLGVVLNEVGRTDEAIESWRKVLWINPDHAEAQQEIDKVAGSAPIDSTESTDEAIECPNCGGTILTAVSICPHCDYELFTVCPRCKEYVPADSRRCPRCSYVLKGMGPTSGGEEETPRQEAEVHTRLGLAHLEDGRVPDALREWQEAIVADPTYAVPHFYKGLMFVEQRQAANAVDAFQTALRLDPDYAEAYLELGMICLAQNKRQAARRVFEECLKHQPSGEIQREVQAQLANLR